jgi:hypothetical protein
MSKFEIKLNQENIRNGILKSAGAYSILERLASDIARRASSMSGENYSYQLVAGKNRIYATVRAHDKAAAAENNRHNTLLKALGSGE